MTKRSAGNVKKRVIQSHHIIYAAPDHPEQEVIVKLFKGEHLMATRLQWYCRRRVSKGLIKLMKVFIAINEDRAEDI